MVIGYWLSVIGYWLLAIYFGRAGDSCVHFAPVFPVTLIAFSIFIIKLGSCAKLDSCLLRLPEIDDAFAPLPRDPLPFPALFIASRSDPYHDYEASEELAYAWGARIADAGHAGHINAESGHGPWPEGLMSFAGFLKKL